MFSHYTKFIGMYTPRYIKRWIAAFVIGIEAMTLGFSAFCTYVMLVEPDTYSMVFIVINAVVAAVVTWFVGKMMVELRVFENCCGNVRDVEAPPDDAYFRHEGSEDEAAAEYSSVSTNEEEAPVMF